MQRLLAIWGKITSIFFKKNVPPPFADFGNVRIESFGRKQRLLPLHHAQNAAFGWIMSYVNSVKSKS